MCLTKNVNHWTIHTLLLNDVPPAAKSCLVYTHNDLKEHSPNPPIYPLPSDFQPYRELQSLEAVFKTIPGDTDDCIFSHMLVSPDDLDEVFGEGFIRRMHNVQELVRYFSITKPNSIDYRPRKEL